MVKEEKLDIDGLGVGIVAEKSNEHFKHLYEGLRRFVLENLVDLLDDLFSHKLSVLHHVVLESL